MPLPQLVTMMQKQVTSANIFAAAATISAAHAHAAILAANARAVNAEANATEAPVVAAAFVGLRG